MPEVLIKADDLRPDKLSRRWQAFLEFCAEKQIHANVGVMGGWTQAGGDDEHAKPEAASAMLEWLLAQPTLHIWNHGFTHHGDRSTGTSEFMGASVTDQFAAIRKTQDRIEQLCGVRMNAFGAPFNWTDHNTVVALQEFPEIEFTFYTPYVPGKVNYHHELFVTCEPFLGKVRPGAPRRFDLTEALQESRHFRNIGRSFVLQIHPNRWTEGALEDFASFIETLTEEGYRTGTIESLAEQDLFTTLSTPRRPLPHRAGARHRQKTRTTDRPSSSPKAAPEQAPRSQSRPRWTQRLSAPIRRAMPESIRRRLREKR
jgi:peptidoglycan/xylan/chitin deacetylase (PgdA/CDA1 family)